MSHDKKITVTNNADGTKTIRKGNLFAGKIAAPGKGITNPSEGLPISVTRFPVENGSSESMLDAAKEQFAARLLQNQSVPVGTPRPMAAKKFAGLRLKGLTRIVAGVGAAAVLAMTLTACSAGEGDAPSNDYVAACVDRTSQMVVQDDQCQFSELTDARQPFTPFYTPYYHPFAWNYIGVGSLGGDLMVGSSFPSGGSMNRPAAVTDQGLFTASSGRVARASTAIGGVSAGKISGYSSGGFKPSSISNSGFKSAGSSFGSHASGGSGGSHSSGGGGHAGGSTGG